MGCYNCIHKDAEAAVKFWATKRQKDLEVAMQQALIDPLKEQAPQVIQIRRMVDAADKGVAAGLLAKCKVNGSPADLISIGFLCDKWTGAQGSSVARDGSPVDKLPGELMEQVASGELTKRKIT